MATTTTAAVSSVLVQNVPTTSTPRLSSLKGNFGYGVRISSKQLRQRQLEAAVVHSKCHSGPSGETETAPEAFDTKNFRRSLNTSGNYNRSGFGLKKEMLALINEEYTSMFTSDFFGLIRTSLIPYTIVQRLKEFCPLLSSFGNLSHDPLYNYNFYATPGSYWTIMLAVIVVLADKFRTYLHIIIVLSFLCIFNLRT